MRFLREIGVVVAGILIAFALDAGWEQRTKRAQERDHLRALASDFRQNAEQLGRLIATEERISASSRTLLSLAQRPGRPPADSVTRLFGMVFTSNRYEPVMGAYEALVNSVGLTLIRDDTLRAALADFSAQVNNRYYERFSDELYISFVREFAGQLRFYENMEEVMRNEDAYPSLLRDRKFQEYLALRHLSERDVARRYRRLLVQSQVIIARLEARLK